MTLNCKFCDENTGKYTCPKCNSDYCSVSCYRSPSHAECSEAFYRECIEHELQTQEPNIQARNKMLKILKENYNKMELDSESDDSDDDDNLLERLKDINLDDSEQVWSILSAEERKEFLDLANTGEITKLVPLWVPWWIQTCRNDKVQFVESSDEFKKLCPVIKSSIPLLQNISKTTPSVLVLNNVINVVAAYVMVSRFLNGDHHNSPHEATSLILEISKNLSSNVVYDTLKLSIESVAYESINNHIIAATIENVNVMKNDVACIALGPSKNDPSYYMLAAISDTSSLLIKAMRPPKHHSHAQIRNTVLPAEFDKKQILNFNKKQIMLAEKKLQYYLSWISACYIEIIDELSQSFKSEFLV